MKRVLADVAGRAAAALVWALVVVTVAILAAIVGLALVVRHVWRVLLAWPERVGLLDPEYGPVLDPEYDMDAELSRLIAEEEARQRRFPADGGSVRGWLAVSGAVLGVGVCAVVIFVLAALNVGGFNQ